ncbi:MAG: two-component sensor histidine kinase [Ruminococcus sp.]|nr:two-component sensor histidine kinase [Ruminococcus sp.]
MKLINRKLPLKVYLSLAFLLFSVLLIIIMWLFQNVFFESFYRGVKTRQVTKCADSIAHHIEDDDLDSMLKEIEEQNDMSISVYDSSTDILTPIHTPHKFLYSNSLINMSSIYEYYQSATLNGGEITIKSYKDDNNPFSKKSDFAPALERERVEFLKCAQIVETEDAQYFVVVESEITPVSSIVDTLKFQLIIMTFFIFIISIFIAVITSHYLSKPIRETNEKAKQLAVQNYDITFSGANYKELSELNDTLTYSARELNKVDTLRRELIANISHDLRTPLTMITGYSEVMRDLPGENSPENIQIVIDEANRLTTLVNDMLDISKLESGAIPMEKSVFNLTTCIKDIFKRYTKLIEQDGYNIVFEYEEDAFVLADPLRISQVMYNLINNAINYCGEDKTIIVKQNIVNSNVCVEVIDHGDGIDESKLDYIWDRYYKVDKEHKTAVVGTGLGLSIVKSILTQHNAQFGVNTKIGEGSDFWWILLTADKEHTKEND